MARKLRYEEEGGLYHVINRGNYRNAVFGSVGAAQAFETALWEAVKLKGWRVHGYVLMTNHYHLALETPTPNLVEGMHWLQSTFATRFNRFRGERGHLFQGRYQALPVENTAALAAVVDYIHLNPLRAKVVEGDQLSGFRWSSLRRFLRGERPEGLAGKVVMEHWGLTDDAKGWQAYLTRLRELAEDEAEQKRLGFDTMCNGWAIGTAGWKRAVAKTLADKSLVGLAQNEAREVREARWEGELDRLLGKSNRSRDALTPLKPGQKGEMWRFELVATLRGLGASFPWLATALGYASAPSLRVRLHQWSKIND